MKLEKNKIYIANQNISLEEALTCWDNNDAVCSIKMGGIDEQTIQVGIFELIKKIVTTQVSP